MALTFQLEPLAPMLEDCKTLVQLHWEGTQTFRRHRPFNPDWDRYVSCNEADFLRIFTARDEGRLVGYFGWYVTQSMHSREWIATEDTFFLHPDYRGGRNALRFFRFALDHLKAMGVVEVLSSCEVDNDTGIHRLLTYLGFAPTIMQYSLDLSPIDHPVTEETTHVRTVTAPCA